MAAYRLGVDIGGTKAMIGLVQEDGQVADTFKVKTPSDVDARTAIEQIFKEAEGFLWQKGLTFADLVSIGMGVPGTVETETGLLLNAPNLGWKHVPCGIIAKALTGRPVYVAQDSRAAAFAEYLFGFAKGEKVLVGITLGTGIGCGIVIDGKIFHGGFNAAGESGHINAVPMGRPCGCGRFGCVERYAAGTGIVQSAQAINSLRGLTCEQVFGLAEEGHTEAAALIFEAAQMLGRALCSIINVLSPNAMVFSGGMCQQEALYVKPVIDYIRNNAYSVSAEGIRLGVSTLGSLAPVIGAAMLDLA